MGHRSNSPSDPALCQGDNFLPGVPHHPHYRLRLHPFYNSSLICLSLFAKLQVAILGRSSREMSQTVRINCRSFLSRVRISVRPSHLFKTEKHPTTIAKPRKHTSNALLYSVYPAVQMSTVYMWTESDGNMYVKGIRAVI